MIETRRYAHIGAAAAALAEEIAAALREAVAARGAASLALAGGTTPAPLYRVLASASVPWSAVTITLTDERWIDPASEASNEALVRRTLVDAVPARFVPLKAAAQTPEAAIPEVERALSAAPAPLDVCVLGLGADGHVASLFPGAPLRRDGLVQAVHAPGAAGAAARISLTAPVLAAARRLILLFAGPEKQAQVDRALSGGAHTPLAHVLAAASGHVTIAAVEETSP